MARLTHLGLHYQDERDLLAHSVPFVRQGLDLGEPVLIALPQTSLERLPHPFRPRRGRHLHRHSGRRAQPGPDPAVGLSLVRRGAPRAQGAHPRRADLAGPVRGGLPGLPAARGAGEPGAQRRRPHRDVHLRPLSPAASRPSADSYYTHPLLLDDQSEPKPSPLYAEADLPRHYFPPLPPPPPDSARLAFGIDDLHAVRELVAAQASQAVGDGPERGANLQLAATEAATNAILHGGGRGLLFVWGEDDSVVCEFQSDLPLPSPLAGSRQVPPTGRQRARPDDHQSSLRSGALARRRRSLRVAALVRLREPTSIR